VRRASTDTRRAHGASQARARSACFALKAEKLSDRGRVRRDYLAAPRSRSAVSYACRYAGGDLAAIRSSVCWPAWANSLIALSA